MAKVNHAFGGLSLFNLKKNNHLLQKDIYELKMNVYVWTYTFSSKNKLNNVYVNPNIHIKMKSKFIDSQYQLLDISQETLDFVQFLIFTLEH